MAAALDEDTAETLASGRETLGAVFRSAQRELQKVFMLWVVAFIGMFTALRVYIWDWLKAVTEANMDSEVAAEHEILVTTPFEVILLQAKIGIVFGILVIIPALIYLSRRELKEAGKWPDIPMSRGRIVLLSSLCVALFIGGIVYAYWLFFPIMFDFLATQAINTGVAPTYRITDWTEFLILLTLSFGLAAQLPLAMTALSYGGIVKYETFRDKWKWAVIAIFGFGALFSPPDPFTQIMWAAPLVGLYAFSLALSKIATNIRRASQDETSATKVSTFKRRVLAVLIVAVLIGVGTAVALDEGLVTLPGAERDPMMIGLYAGIAAVAIPFAIYLVSVLRAPVYPPRNPTDPSQVDLTLISAERVRQLPAEVFEEMDEESAVGYAQDALSDDQPEKARAIFDRFDTEQAEAAPSDGDGPPGDAGDAEVDEGDQGLITGTATGMLSSFSSDSDDEEIGGYFDDMKYVVGSLRSRLFHMFAVGLIVLAVVFTFLYQGGLGYIKDDFIDRMPQAVVPADLTIVALHPVEVLIFIVKFSTLAALVAVVPMLLYYAWPAMEEIGWIRGNRDIVFKWTAGMLTGLTVGTMLGYFVIAPAVISYLVYDAVQAGMIINYRINSFAWLIIFLTVGIGLLTLIPFTMWMMYLGEIASYHAMRDRWREVTIAAFVFTAMFTPADVLTMFLVGIPVMIFYWAGLAGLWVVTLGGRRGRFARAAPS